MDFTKYLGMNEKAYLLSIREANIFDINKQLPMKKRYDEYIFYKYLKNSTYQRNKGRAIFRSKR